MTAKLHIPTHHKGHQDHQGPLGVLGDLGGERRIMQRAELMRPELDVERIRADFPIRHQQVHGRPLVYLDNAASAQKPRAVIDAVARFDSTDYANIHRGVHTLSQQKVHGRPVVYLDNAASAQKPRAVIDAVARFDSTDYANIHRGVHTLSQRATEAFEASRDRVQQFINAGDRKEIIFTRGTTESINLVAQSYARTVLNLGDEIVISAMEHHSNIVPWQMVCRERGAVLRVIPMTDDGELMLDAYEEILGPRTRLVAIVHVSNALGTINPMPRMIELAHRHGIPMLVDGAQAVPHL